MVKLTAQALRNVQAGIKHIVIFIHKDTPQRRDAERRTDGKSRTMGKAAGIKKPR